MTDICGPTAFGQVRFFSGLCIYVHDGSVKVRRRHIHARVLLRMGCQEWPREPEAGNLLPYADHRRAAALVGTRTVERCPPFIHDETIIFLPTRQRLPVAQSTDKRRADHNLSFEDMPWPGPKSLLFKIV